MKKRRFLSAWLFSCCVGVGLLLPALAQGADLEKVTVLTNHTFIGKYAPFFVGMDKGYYRDAGLEVKVLPTSGSGFVISAVEGGKADYGVADVGPVVQSIVKGSQVRGMFVYMNKSAVGLASFTPFPDLQSIRGKKIAASQADSARVALRIVLGKNHLSDMPIQWVAADPNVYFSLLLDDRVDLASSSIDGDVPALQKIAAPRGKQVHFLSLYDWGYNIYGLWLIANRAKLQAQPDQVRQFADATRKAMLYAIEHPEETADIMVHFNPILNRDTILSQWRQSIKAMGADPTQGGHYGLATVERLESTIDIVGQALNLDVAGVSPADVFDASMTRP